MNLPLWGRWIAAGTEAERAQWAQMAKRSVGNRKERLRDYASFPGQTDEVPARRQTIRRRHRS